MRFHTHVGVYGVVVANSHVVLVEKARGPYLGLLDLPGGKIEEDESPETALRRELLEETNIVAKRIEILNFHSYVTTYLADDGQEERFNHFGAIYTVECENLNELKLSADGHDSLGARLYDLESLDEEQLTPFAQKAIGELKCINCTSCNTALSK